MENIKLFTKNGKKKNEATYRVKHEKKIVNNTINMVTFKVYPFACSNTN